MKYNVKITSKFKKDLKIVIKRGYDMQLMDYVVDNLAKGKALEPKFKDHALTGNYNGYRECHLTPDWLLIYQINKNDLILYLTRTGSHSDLF